MDVARSAPQGAHYHADVIYLLPYLGIKMGARALWYHELSLHQLGSRPTVFIPRWTTHPCILYQVCATRGAKDCCCSARDSNSLPFGHHTLGIECKGVLPTGVDRMLVGNRVGVGLTRSTIRHLLPSLFPVKGASK